MEGYKNSGETIPFGSLKDQIDQIVHVQCRRLLKSMRRSINSPLADELGISVALFYPGDQGIRKFYKYGKAGPDQKITESTVFALGSVTKAFTAILTAILQVKNVIGPMENALVAPYFPVINQPSPYWDTATFLDFATHTSGMPDKSPDGQPSVKLFDGYAPSEDFVGWWNDENLQKNWAHRIQQNEWIYSNPGFVTLGFAAVAAAQASMGADITYGDLLEEITGTLGMKETFVGSDVPIGAVESIGHAKGRAVAINGAVDLKSSARDMHTFLAALNEAMQLSSQGSAMSVLQEGLALSTQKWKTATNPKTGVDMNMGLGWQLTTTGFLDKNGATSRGGSSCDVRLRVFAEGKQPVGIAVMTNQVGSKRTPSSVAKAIVEAIAGLAD